MIKLTKPMVASRLMASISIHHSKEPDQVKWQEQAIYNTVN